MFLGATDSTTSCLVTAECRTSQFHLQQKQTHVSGRHRQYNFLSCYSRMQNITVPSATKTNYYYLLLFLYVYNILLDYSCVLTLPYSVSCASLSDIMNIRFKFNYFHFLSPEYGRNPKHKDSQKIFRML